MTRELSQPTDMMAAVEDTMAERTGRSLDEWVALVESSPRGTLRVGLRYRGEVPDDPRLEPSKGFAQATHWLHLDGATDPASVGDLEPLIAAAYAQNG